ncbi:MAG: YbhB/YbcL family Raf kinase inhibitor-like protein [Minisyncoccota bacterium]
MQTTLTLTSSAFANGGMIPAKYTCDGDSKLSPPLAIGGVPEEAESLVLTMDDPDIPKAAKERLGIEAFDHWTLFNIPPETREIPEGGTVGTHGATTRSDLRYTGPCPPSEYEPREHRYIFTLYALRAPLTLAEGAMKREVLAALAPLVIEKAELIGRYSRK